MKRLISILLVLSIFILLEASAYAINPISNTNSDFIETFHSYIETDASIRTIATKSVSEYTESKYTVTYNTGIVDTVTERLYWDNRVIMTFENGTLSNSILITPDGSLYLDGTQVKYNIDYSPNISPRAGSQHISSETSLTPNASYTKYLYDEIYSVDLGEAYANLVFSTFVTVITYKWSLVSAAIAIALPVLNVYFVSMRENRSTYQYAYMKTKVYTTPTITNPPYQYFKYLHYYYEDKVNGELKFLVGSETTYGALVPTI